MTFPQDLNRAASRITATRAGAAHTAAATRFLPARHTATDAGAADRTTAYRTATVRERGL